MPSGLELYEIEKATWAVFNCVGKLPEAMEELKRRKSYVHPKGNGYEIVEYYLLEYDCLDSDTVIGFGRLIDIAKLEEKDRVLELIKAAYKRGENWEV